MRHIFKFLMYLVVVVRAVEFHYYDEPVPALAFVLLALFGLLLFSEALISETRFWRGLPPQRLAWVSTAYLLAQTALTLAILLVAPDLDFLPILFAPLSIQAVLLFGRSRGFLWIAAFSLAIAVPLMIGWDWQLPGIAVWIVMTGIYFWAGNYAHLIQRAGASRQENQRIYTDLQAAHLQLQEYAAQAEEFAAAQERSRLAQELHDSVTQTIFSMNLAVQAAQKLHAKDPSRVVEQLDRLQELARSAVGELQVLVDQLRPVSVAGEGLPAALRRLAAERQARDGLQVSLEISGSTALPEGVQTGLFRIVQEALNNITRHAGVNQAVVRLNLEAHPACLEIQDHGSGFDPDRQGRQAGHFGILGMAERARELGWRSHIDAAPGQGVHITVEEALDEPARPA